MSTVPVKISSENLSWVKQHAQDVTSVSLMATRLLDLFCRISSGHFEEQQELLISLTSDLFVLGYEYGHNPLRGESDDISPWDLLDPDQYKSVAEVGKIEIVFHLSKHQALDVYLLGRTSYHPWMIQL